MLAVVIRGNQGTRPNRRNQPDPPRSFPNKRSGRRSKRLTFVTALKYQKDNRRISLQATLHQPPIPGYCFSHCRPFPASLPLTDPESTKRAVIHAAVLWNHPLATMFFAAIRPYRAGLQRDPVIAAFSCNLCRRRSPGHPPPPGKAPCLANWLWLHKIATCVRSFNNLWWPKVPLKKLVGHSGLQLHFIDRNHWLMEASGWRARPVIVWLLLSDLLLLLFEETIFRCSM